MSVRHNPERAGGGRLRTNRVGLTPAAEICPNGRLGLPVQDDAPKRQWSSLFLVLGGLALITAFEAAFVRNYVMVVFLVFAGSFLLISGWITRRRTGPRSLTSQLKIK